MAEYIESLSNLAEKFGRLEGVGKKTAMRMAFSILELETEEAEDFARAILDAKEKIHLCPICQNLTDREVCPICADEERDRSVICVVTDARTVLAMEKVREYRGTYHVLHGLISPMNGITPDPSVHPHQSEVAYQLSSRLLVNLPCRSPHCLP